MSVKFDTPKKPGIKISYPKITRPNTSILIYSIKQTLRPKKKIRDRSLDPKKYGGCKFSTPKNKSDPSVLYTASTPLGRYITCCFYYISQPGFRVHFMLRVIFARSELGISLSYVHKRNLEHHLSKYSRKAISNLNGITKDHLVFI